jgi:uncharacterized membrane protein YeaQ/YmgE (transglycosylase-associated protein family)
MGTFILAWLVVGLVAGFLANLVMHGGHGIIFDILLGLVGAVVGGLILGNFVGYQPTSLIGHIGVAFIGAIILIALVRLVEGRSMFGGVRR